MMKTLTQYLIDEGLYVPQEGSVALISRTDMPQITDDVLLLLDKKFSTSKIKLSADEVKSLRPVQVHIDMDKVKNIDKFTKPIVVSSDKILVDGNHRAAAFVMKMAGSDSLIDVIVIGAEFIDVLAFLRTAEGES
jgi:hypothetical protein